MAMAANLAEIVHRAAIVRRAIVNKVVRVATIAVQTGVPVAAVKAEGDLKVVTKDVPVVAAVDGPSKDSPPRSSWRS
jgi:hypothetical protein